MTHHALHTLLGSLILGVTATGMTQEASAPDSEGPTPRTAFVSPLQEARIDAIAGRAVVVGGGAEGITVRRGEMKRSSGRSHLEVAVGGHVRVRWTETMSLDVFGPSSFEWAPKEGHVDVIFHQLTWADIDVRRGEHSFELPASWFARVGRSAARLRGIAGGPTELMLHAGQPIELEWRGSASQPIPPVAVYPGSSVRLDQPRHVKTGQTSAEGMPERQAWTAGGEDESVETVWPWRSRADTPEQAARRLEAGRTTRSINEMPGVPGGRVERVRRIRVDDSTSKLQLDAPEVETYAQVPFVSPVPPRFAIEITSPDGTAPRLNGGTVTSPAAPPSAGGPGSRANEIGPAQPMGERSGHDVVLRGPAGASNRPIAPEAVGAMRFASQEVEKDSQGAAAGAHLVPFQSEQWRGLSRNQLNGTGRLAAEKGTGVEFRVLGGGRMKVFVSGGSPSPRWCFTPQRDYLLQPGAVAVFEPNGRMRMSFGTIEEHQPIAGRPSYDRLPKK